MTYPRTGIKSVARWCTAPTLVIYVLCLWKRALEGECVLLPTRTRPSYQENVRNGPNNQRHTVKASHAGVRLSLSYISQLKTIGWDCFFDELKDLLNHPCRGSLIAKACIKVYKPNEDGSIVSQSNASGSIYLAFELITSGSSRVAAAILTLYEPKRWGRTMSIAPISIEWQT
ncbi:hypothetical protein BX616_005903 [Lobosporangium transversale]|nr:hypothetical protein BCR41DRAFT_376007 [Lobosporangium transversale]KAF9897261.1 hypothetical protein BX616_005903 [Lobosporangium transversale]ORY93695.1 hypothetical protein BCR41DRAFT_376007 [Lobosporangium transversale]|eukprot:XP_021875190.1 hypothetical protein BCR41DRAFT_376007 [Lobosporangium transversale]